MRGITHNLYHVLLSLKRGTVSARNITLLSDYCVNYYCGLLFISTLRFSQDFQDVFSFKIIPWNVAAILPGLSQTQHGWAKSTTGARAATGPTYSTLIPSTTKTTAEYYQNNC